MALKHPGEQGSPSPDTQGYAQEALFRADLWVSRFRLAVLLKDAAKPCANAS